MSVTPLNFFAISAILCHIEAYINIPSLKIGNQLANGNFSRVGEIIARSNGNLVSL